MKNNKEFIPILILSITVAILVLGGGIYYFLIEKPRRLVGCTEEAKLCPDGSAVGRTGPNCEFAPCPNTKPNEVSDCWETYYKDEEHGFEIRYPKWWNVYKSNGGTLFKDVSLEDIPDEWFNVDIKDNEYDFSNYDFSKEKMVDKVIDKEEINISGIDGFKYTFYPKSELYILTKYIVLNYKGHGWALSYGYDLSQGLENQILFTFKFIR